MRVLMEQRSDGMLFEKRIGHGFVKGKVKVGARLKLLDDGRFEGTDADDFDAIALTKGYGERITIMLQPGRYFYE